MTRNESAQEGWHLDGDMAVPGSGPAIIGREELLDDLTRPGIDAVAVGPRPLLDRRSWMSRCAAAVRERSVREVDALAALLEDGQPVAEAFRVERYWPRDRGAAAGKPGGPRISAAWAALDVAYAICDPSQENERLDDAAARWRRACVLPGESSQLAAGSPGMTRFQPAGRMPGTLTEDPTLGYARLMSQALSGTLPRSSHQVHVALVFGGPEDGAHGQLTLAVQPGGPRGLYPDPRSMAFLAADPEFADSLDMAWRNAPEVIKNQCVVWDISDDDRPFREMVEGGSLGAAFGVGLHELRYATRPLGRARVRRLDPRCAISGSLDSDGRLLPVADYKAKFKAARRQRWRIVVPAGDSNAVKHPGILRRVSYAPDLKTAIRKSRLLRMRSHGIIAIVVLLVLGSGAVALAARSQEGTQAAIATARQVDSLAMADLGTSLDTAELLVVGAYQLHDDPQTEAALFQVATATPQLVTYYQAPGPVTSLGTSADGQVVVSGTANGEVTWFNPATGAHHIISTKLGPISKIVVNAAGTVVMAANTQVAILWEPQAGHTNVISPSGGDITSIALSPSGNLAAIIQPDSQPDTGRLLIRNMLTGRRDESQFTGSYDQVTFASPQAVMIYNSCGFWKSFDLPAVTEASSGGKAVCPATNAVNGGSPNGEFSAYATYGSVTAWDSADTSRIFSANGIAPTGAASSVTVSDDGKQAAIVEGGSIFVAPLRPYSLEGGTGQVVTKLSSNGDTAIAAFMGGSSRLVSATGTAVVLWDLSRGSRIGGDTGIPAPWTNLAGLPSELSMSPDGHILAIEGGAVPYTEYRIGKSLTKLAVWTNPTSGGLFEWRNDKPIFLDWTDRQVSIVDSRGRALRKVEATVGGTSYIMAILAARNGSEAVFVDQSANIWVLDFDSGRVSHFTAAPGSFAFSGQDVAVSADGRFAIICDHGHGRVIAVNLASGSTHVVGSGPADGVLYDNGNILIQRDSGPLEIWDESGSHLLRSLPGDGGYASAMTAAADGTRIARLTDNGAVSILSTTTGDVLGTFTLPSGGGGAYNPWLATSMQFTPDGDTLFAETSGGQLTRWLVYIPALAKIACATAGRAMTAAQWRDLVGTNPPARLPCQG